MGGEGVEGNKGKHVRGTICHLLACLIGGGFGIGDDGHGNDALGHAAQMRFGDDLLEKVETVDFVIRGLSPRGLGDFRCSCLGRPGRRGRYVGGAYLLIVRRVY